MTFAGIPISLPVWTQVSAYVFLGLFAAYIGVKVWQNLLMKKDRTQLGEIHAKVNIMLLTMRGWNRNTDSESENETTVDHGKLIS